MEKKGRKCEKVKVGDDTLYFLDEFKGKEVMRVMDIMFEDTSLGKDSSDIDVGKLMVNIPKLFPIFCITIEKGEEEVNPTIKYLEELPADQYIKIQNLIGTYVTKMLNGSGKKA